MSMLAVVAYGAVWPLILERLGAPVPRDSVRIFLQSQLGKYLPGSVWHYAGRVGLARARGVAARLTLTSIGIEVAASALAAGLVGLFVLPWALAIPLTLALGALTVLASRRPGGSARRLLSPALRAAGRVTRVPEDELAPALRALPATAALYVPVWVLYGIAFWLTGRALFPVGAGDLVFFTAAFALGWLAGMIAVFAPGGIGVREAVLVALLSPRIGPTEAMVVAGASRVVLTAADLLGAAVAFALSSRTRGDSPTEVDHGRAHAS
jgi:uncharacterized membrane protein YbhN (UPF0104 family)